MTLTLQRRGDGGQLLKLDTTGELQGDCCCGGCTCEGAHVSYRMSAIIWARNWLNPPIYPWEHLCDREWTLTFDSCLFSGDSAWISYPGPYTGTHPLGEWADCLLGLVAGSIVALMDCFVIGGPAYWQTVRVPFYSNWPVPKAGDCDGPWQAGPYAPPAVMPPKGYDRSEAWLFPM